MSLSNYQCCFSPLIWCLLQIQARAAKPQSCTVLFHRLWKKLFNATQGHAKLLLFSSSVFSGVQFKKTTAPSLAQKSISEQSLFSAAKFFTSLKINESTLRDGKQGCQEGFWIMDSRGWQLRIQCSMLGRVNGRRWNTSEEGHHQDTLWRFCVDKFWLISDRSDKMQPREYHNAVQMPQTNAD